jgi:long-chain acyl-CoA synthetase
VRLAERFEYYGKNGVIYDMKLAIARKLIFSKWKEALGGEVQLAASGSAALSPRLNRIFNAAGIPVMEGFGLTETSPVISVNEIDNEGVRFGTCGRPLFNVEVKIAKDGEILCKGPNVMMGYYNKPEMTAEVIDKDGWFHTGDIGELVDGQFLKITDRKKEIFKTSGGKYVAPQIMENVFKQSSLIEQIMVIGENKKHPSALIVPNFASLSHLCKEKNIKFSSDGDAIHDPLILQIYQEVLDTYNAEFNQWEQVKKFALLDKEWSIDGGELTPTLKLRRKKVFEKYSELIDKIYSEED